MTHCTTRAIPTTVSWQRTATAALFCTPLVAIPLSANAQDVTSISEEEAYRLAPIIVNTQAAASDDASTVVAQELWVGGKVATSILNTP
ncbi:MAG: ligand-gated channel, partial [Pseudomonas orientalis]|nr:ligand-gated channel [Pseudomonas orientalis]